MMDKKILNRLSNIANLLGDSIVDVEKTYSNKTSFYVARDLIQNKPIQGIMEARTQSYHCLGVMERYAQIYKTK